MLCPAHLVTNVRPPDVLSSPREAVIAVSLRAVNLQRMRQMADWLEGLGVLQNARGRIWVFVKHFAGAVLAAARATFGVQATTFEHSSPTA